MDRKFLWVEEYRPHTIEDCILPIGIKESFQGFIKQKQIPNLLLTGTAGIGKTTVARALCDEIGASYIVINGSDEGRFLDTVRTRIRKFASTVSLTSTGSCKVVIIDEADNTTNDVQLSLRTAVEEFHENCRFIFTCNFPNKIIEPLHSRCTVIPFRIRNGDKPLVQVEFYNRLKTILTENKIKFDDNVIMKLISKYFPDWRRLINETQRHAANGAIDSSILMEVQDLSLNDLMKSLKNREFTTVKKWVVDNIDNDYDTVIRRLYDSLYDTLKKPSIPEAVLILAKYQYQAAFVTDHEVNMLACLTEVMMSCEFK